MLEENVHRHEFHFPEHRLEPNQRFLSVSAAFVESEIHHCMTEAKAVAVAHFKVAVGTVGRVRGDGDVEGWHTGDVDVLLKGPVRHGDGFGGGDHGGSRGAQIRGGDFEILGVRCGIGAFKAPSTTVVLHLNTEGRCSSFALEVPVKPVEHFIGPIPSKRVGVRLRSFARGQ